MWGTLSGSRFKQLIRETYDEVVHRRRNIFLVPAGKVGKRFVNEITRLINVYTQSSAMESSAIDAVMVASQVLL